MISCGNQRRGPCLERWALADFEGVFITTASACPLARNPTQEHWGLPRISGQSSQLALAIYPALSAASGNRPSSRFDRQVRTPAPSSLRHRSPGSQPRLWIFLPVGHTAESQHRLSLFPASGRWGPSPLLLQTREPRPRPLSPNPGTQVPISLLPQTQESGAPV